MKYLGGIIMTFLCISMYGSAKVGDVASYMFSVVALIWIKDFFIGGEN